MPLTLPNIALKVYTLPADGPQAEADFLALLRSPGETWGAIYSFNLAALAAEIEASDATGVAQHWLLDRTQAAGHAEAPVLAAMLPRLRHSDLTISTAGPDSRSPSQILHTKAMVVRATDGGEDWVWVGSVNFTGVGFLEANIAVAFRSNAYADVFRSWHERTRSWALTHVPQLAPPTAVAVVPVPVAIVTPEGVAP